MRTKGHKEKKGLLGGNAMRNDAMRCDAMRCLLCFCPLSARLRASQLCTSSQPSFHSINIHSREHSTKP